MITDIKANVNQIPVDVLTEGTKDYPALSKAGQLFTANWKTRLVLAGLVYRLSMGTIAGSADVTMVGTGTVLDLDLPSGIIAADSGRLIPIELNLGLKSLMDAASDEAEVLMTADRATAVSASDIAAATLTQEVPDNLLDGGPAFGGRAVSVVTATPITDPVHSDVLLYHHFESLGIAVSGQSFTVHKEWDYPNIIAGPCSLLLYVGGTIATTFIGSLVFAHVPEAWFPVA